MKRILCTAILAVLFGLPALPQAGHVHKRTLEHPGFITSNTSEIEISRIVLSNEQTQVDAVLYGKPGTPAVISADTYLVSEKSRFRLREAEHISIDGMTEPESIPESGKMNITLSFAPIPRGTHEVDFVERESGWNIYGIQLSRKEPYVYVPNFLLSSPAGQTPELPEPGLFSGKAIINGYILGYDPRLELDMQLSYKDMLFPKPWTDGITVRQDGSFHAEIDFQLFELVHIARVLVQQGAEVGHLHSVAAGGQDHVAVLVYHIGVALLVKAGHLHAGKELVGLNGAQQGADHGAGVAANGHAAHVHLLAVPHVAQGLAHPVEALDAHLKVFPAGDVVAGVGAHAGHAVQAGHADLPEAQHVGHRGQIVDRHPLGEILPLGQALGHPLQLLHLLVDGVADHVAVLPGQIGQRAEQLAVNLAAGRVPQQPDEQDHGQVTEERDRFSVFLKSLH